MQNNAEHELVRLKNELRAQKQASELSWGQLALPENTPIANWNGNIDVSNPISTGNDALVCKFLARYTRTDGNPGAPLVQFAYDFNVSPTGIEIERANGGTVSVSGSEKQLYQSGATGLVVDAGTDYVEYEIQFPDNGYLMSYLYYLNYGTTNVHLDLSVAAISPVKGTLTLERRYDV